MMFVDDQDALKLDNICGQLNHFEERRGGTVIEWLSNLTG